MTIAGAYRQERRRGGGLPIPARYALAIAQERAKSATDYGWTEDRGDTLTAERGGFSLRASWAYDEYARLDDMGYGSFDTERGADRWAVPVYFERGGVGLASGQNAKDWYHPMHTQAQYEWYRKAGASRSVAEEWARQHARDEAIAAGESSEHVITVMASRAGIELGSASLGGFGFDPDDYDQARQIAAAIEEHGLADEAIEDARRSLAALSTKGVLA